MALNAIKRQLNSNFAVNYPHVLWLISFTAYLWLIRPSNKITFGLHSRHTLSSWNLLVEMLFCSHVSYNLNSTALNRPTLTFV